MAVRLQMKLGFVAEPDRLPDSPDTIRTQEPSVGAVMRSKGQLYVLVTCRVPGDKAREATRLVADTIEHEYYYDESAGIRVCLEKAIRAANKKLAHAGDRFGLGRAADGNGPVGVAAAVVRSNELYVGDGRARPRRTSSARRASPRCPTRTVSAGCRRRASSRRCGAAR